MKEKVERNGDGISLVIGRQFQMGNSLALSSIMIKTVLAWEL